VLPEKLRQHGGACAVEEVAAAHAQDGRAPAPARRESLRRQGRESPGVIVGFLQGLVEVGVPVRTLGGGALRIRLRNGILVLRELVDHVPDRVLDMRQPVRFERPSIGVRLCERQALQGDLVVIGAQRVVLQEVLGLLDCLGRVARQHALVEVLRDGQRRPVSQHDVQESEPIHVTPEHHQTDRERGREEEADRAPQPRPEGDGRDDRDRG
jgi:hypothetical protein